MSPASVDQYHGARTRLGPRGGGRLHVLSPHAVTPTSIVCFTGAPGRRRETVTIRVMCTWCPADGLGATPSGGGTRLLTRTIASDATYSVAGKRVASVGPAASPAKRSRIAYAVAGR